MIDGAQDDGAKEQGIGDEGQLTQGPRLYVLVLSRMAQREAWTGYVNPSKPSVFSPISPDSARPSVICNSGLGVMHMCEGNSHHLLARWRRVYSCTRLLRVYQLLRLCCSWSTARHQQTARELAARSGVVPGLWAGSRIRIGNMELHAPSNPKLLSPAAKPLSSPERPWRRHWQEKKNKKKPGDLQPASWLISPLRGRCCTICCIGLWATAASSLRVCQNQARRARRARRGICTSLGWWDGGMWWDGWWGMLPGVGFWMDGRAGCVRTVPTGCQCWSSPRPSSICAPQIDRGGSAILASRTLPLVVSTGEIPQSQSQSQREGGLVSTLNLHTGKNATLWRVEWWCWADQGALTGRIPIPSSPHADAQCVNVSFVRPMRGASIQAQPLVKFSCEPSGPQDPVTACLMSMIGDNRATPPTSPRGRSGKIGPLKLPEPAVEMTTTLLRISR